MRERFSIDYIASGQPRPYADTRIITRVHFEKTNHQWSPHDRSKVKMADTPWIPMYFNAKIAEMRLRQIGVIGKDLPFAKDVKHGLNSFIKHIIPIDPKNGSEVGHYTPGEEVSDVWEVYIVQPFCN